MAEIKVTNTLFIQTWDIENFENGLDIIDPTSHGMGTAGVFGHELPALLARLQEAAEAMGVSTKATEWRDLAKRMLEVMRTMAENSEGPADYPATMMEIEQAIAKAEQ